MEPSMRVGAVNVFEDNEGAIKLAINKHASRRTKHIDVKHHLKRDASDARKVRVAYVRSEDQHADLLTKPLDMQKFYKHAKFILNVVWFVEDFHTSKCCARIRDDKNGDSHDPIELSRGVEIEIFSTLPNLVRK